jgi:hypothetical protein
MGRHDTHGDNLDSCLGLAEALAIQQKGVKVYRQLFGSNTIYFWRGVVRSSRDGSLNVPYVCVHNSDVVVRWQGLLDFMLRDDCPAARFAS